MRRTRNEWYRAHGSDAFYERQLMDETLTEAAAAFLILAADVPTDMVRGMRLATPDGEIELSRQQVNGLMHTLALAFPDEYLNQYDDAHGMPEGIDDDMAWAERVSQQEYDDYVALRDLGEEV